MTPYELFVQILASGAAQREQSADLTKAYSALRGHLTQHYPDLDLTPLEKRPDSASKRASLVEDMKETAVASDQTLLTLAIQLVAALVAHPSSADQPVAVELEEVRAELIRLANIRSSGKATRLKRARACQLTIDDAQAGAGDAHFQAEFKQSTIDKLEVNLHTGGANPAALRQRYAKWILASLNRLQLDGIDPTVTQQEGAARMELSGVYTALLTRAPEQVEQLGRRKAEARPEIRHLSAVEQLDRHAKLVLLGDPGSGKST
jgi:hypothetical protein